MKNKILVIIFLTLLPCSILFLATHKKEDRLSLPADNLLISPAPDEKVKGSNIEISDIKTEVINNEPTQVQNTNNPEGKVMDTTSKTKLSRPAMSIDQNKTYTAIFHTNRGDMEFSLDAKNTPVTVNNFVALAKMGFYDDLVFHRVIEGFMIQGGDPLGSGMGGPGYKFEDEQSPNKLVKGSLAMANSGPNTNGSQFFIVTAESTPWLDGKHTNFGQITKGLEVALEIEKTQTDGSDRPLSEIVINSLEIIEQ